MRRIGTFKPWPLPDVLTTKYSWLEEEALAFSEFLLPMLELDPSKRATAAECLQHPWLRKDA